MSLNDPSRSTDKPAPWLQTLRTLTAENPGGRAVGNITPFMPRPAEIGNGLAEGLNQAADVIGKMAVEKKKASLQVQQLRDEVDDTNRLLNIKISLAKWQSEAQTNPEYQSNPDKYEQDYVAKYDEVFNQFTDGLPESRRLGLSKSTGAVFASGYDEVLTFAEKQRNKNTEASIDATLNDFQLSGNYVEDGPGLLKGIRDGLIYLSEVEKLAPMDPDKKKNVLYGFVKNSLAKMALSPEGLEQVKELIDGKITLSTGLGDGTGEEKKIRLLDYIDATDVSALYNAAKRDIEHKQREIEVEEEEKKDTVDRVSIFELNEKIDSGTATALDIENLKDVVDPVYLPALTTAQRRLDKQVEWDVKDRKKELETMSGVALVQKKKDLLLDATLATGKTTLAGNVSLNRAIKEKDIQGIYRARKDIITKVYTAFAAGALSDPVAKIAVVDKYINDRLKIREGTKAQMAVGFNKQLQRLYPVVTAKIQKAFNKTNIDFMLWAEWREEKTGEPLAKDAAAFAYKRILEQNLTESLTGVK